MTTSILTYPKRLEATTSLEGKFLQLRWAGREYLLFAAAGELRYHNQILGRFLAEAGIPHHWEDAQTLVVDQVGLITLGGGRFRLDRSTKTLRVWDASSVYGRFDACALSAALTAADPPWRGLVLNVA
jgi:hypothetical protein